MRLSALLLLLFSGLCHAQYLEHARVPALIETLRRDYGFSAAELAGVRSALAQAQRLPQLVEAEQKAPERTETWTQYSRRIDRSRIDGGVRLLRDYAPQLMRAEREYGVPPSAIAAILGIETRYGSYSGKIRVLDALATQGFDHPTRATFFFGELTEFFAFCRDFGYAPESLTGSYAGAMGAAQFMPSNYRRLALDYNGDGVRDLWNLEDAIGSIANYFTHYRPALAWQRGMPLAVRATLTAPLPAGIEINGKAPLYRIGDLQRAGIVPSVPLPASTLAGLIELPLDGGVSEYWLGLHNFYSVMTYNPRTFYAMAVTQLAQGIEQALSQESSAP